MGLHFTQNVDAGCPKALPFTQNPGRPKDNQNANAGCPEGLRFIQNAGHPKGCHFTQNANAGCPKGLHFTQNAGCPKGLHFTQCAHVGRPKELFSFKMQAVRGASFHSKCRPYEGTVSSTK